MNPNDLQAQREHMMKVHRAEFAEWVRRNNVTVYDDPVAAGIETDLKVGDRVTYKNPAGIKFRGHTILGFRKPGETLPDRVVYLDMGGYWLPLPVKSLTKEE